MRLKVSHNCYTMSKLILLLSLFILLQVFLCSCAKTEEDDIVSQKPVQEGRTQISVLVKYAFAINGFEAAVEEKFPDIDIVQVGNYTRDMGIAEYESRLEHDDLTDIVMTWPLDVGREYWDERLIDLSGMEFTNKYNFSMLNSIADGGKLYYLPGPAQIRGIVYNKTLFEEKGWEVPTDFEGFISLCQTIEESGIRSLQLGFENPEVLDTAFIGYNFGSSFSTPQDMQWIAEYSGGTNSFGEHFSTALDVFKQMIDAGIWKASDLDISYAEREKMLFTRQCAMCEDSVLMARMGEKITGTKDEFAVMPFFNPGDDGDWSRLYMVCYIGLNKHLTESVNKSKYEKVLKLMEYISTTEGQDALMSDTGAMFSGLIGAEPPDIREIEDLKNSLVFGRYAIFPQLANIQEALRKGLAGMIRGELHKEDVIEMVDAQNSKPLVVSVPKEFGIASSDFSLVETGNFVTDCMRDKSGCDFALFLDNGKDGLYNGKGISARLYQGDITEVDIARIMPDLKDGEQRTLCKITMTGADFLRTLEYAIPVNNNQTGWFYYFSGIKMQYDPGAEPGSRIRSITTMDKKQIEPDKIYSIAVMDDSVPLEYIQSYEDTGITISEIVEQIIIEKGEISPSNDGRFDFSTGK